MHEPVARLNWVLIAIKQCAFAGVQWNIQIFFSALDAACLHIEKSMPAKTDLRFSTPDHNINFHWSCEVKKDMLSSSSSIPYSSRTTSSRQYSRRCYSCRKTSHKIRPYTAPLGLKADLNRSLQKDQSYTLSILFEFYKIAETLLS